MKSPRHSQPRAPLASADQPASGLPPLDQPWSLLGGLSPQTFMRRHWQKKPLLIRQAMPGVRPPVTRAEMFELAGQDDVESRLIVQGGKGSGKKAEPQWALHHGPITRNRVPKLTQPRWTLLVQGLDLHVPAAHDILRQFRFVPDARVDDLMISYASDGGGVGPHYDSYDVFLLQVHGCRRWRVGRIQDPALVPDMPVKILANFEPEEEYVLEPGDMLYLPPRWGHDGIAEGECMTCSVGFRVPETTELVRDVLVRLTEELEPHDPPKLYRDPKQTATPEPARIPVDLQQFTLDAVAKALQDPLALKSALGEMLTEPKPRVWFDLGAEPLPPGVGVVLDAKTRMMYDDQCIYANGESWRAAGADARVLRALADRRSLTAAQVGRVSDEVRAVLEQWLDDGWLHPSN
ncbi:MAG: cupin domain-containing protein [Burkholderiales bacterium]|nr:cupin domain-containing protein [Burkholderiales bacterium]MDE2076224.1 cupin domain-containing protein [Burkholderiales bacterium]MDE2431384.1 cupin domain-containing protein [Burkholderiales bacterium]